MLVLSPNNIIVDWPHLLIIDKIFMNSLVLLSWFELWSMDRFEWQISRVVSPVALQVRSYLILINPILWMCWQRTVCNTSIILHILNYDRVLMVFLAKHNIRLFFILWLFKAQLEFITMCINVYTYWVSKAWVELTTAWIDVYTYTHIPTCLEKDP